MKAVMEIATVPLDQLILDPENLRTHGTKNVEAIAGSLAVFGQQKTL